MKYSKNIYLYSLYSIFFRETKRFLGVYNQTIISPIISMFIFVSIILLSRQTNVTPEQITFILTGAVCAGIVQNSFANPSSSIIMSKVLGYVTDILVTPVTSAQIIIGYIASSILRGIIVGALMLFIINFWMPLFPVNLLYFCASVILSSCFMGLLGLYSGIISDNFENAASITNYIVNPLSLLSGTFYSVKNLPTIFQTINKFNPFFYVVDSFRYGMSGVSDVCPRASMLVIIILNSLMFFLIKYYLDTGYGLRK